MLTSTSDIDALNNKITAWNVERSINEGFRGTDIGGSNKLEYQDDKIIALRNDGENFDTLLSANGLFCTTRQELPVQS